MSLRFLLTSILLILVWGCAAKAPFPGAENRPQECSALLAELDRAVDKADVADAAFAPVSGFPYLRTNRFWSALLKKEQNQDAAGLIIDQMHALDIEARSREIPNLPESVLTKLSVSSRAELTQTALACGDKLLAHDRTAPTAPAFLAALKKNSFVPEVYQTWMRLFGYPLASPIVTYLTVRGYEKFRTWYNVPLENLPVLGELNAFVPQPRPMSEAEVTAIIKRSSANPLAVPLPNLEDARALAEAFAPVLIQDISAEYDLPGEVAWINGRVVILGDRPTVYYYFTHALVHNQPILQINYSLWYSRRDGPLPPSIEKGPLDGLTLRVNLDPSGQALMFDAMNTCGCYHLFIPDKSKIEQQIPKAFRADALVPQELPTGLPFSLLQVRINSGWHQIQRVTLSPAKNQGKTYSLVPYAALESLPLGDGRFASLFTPQGIAKDSWRIEPWLLFSMGIPDVGYMRQRGHHALELVGRSHFDDPGLLEENFRFKP